MPREFAKNVEERKQLLKKQLIQKKKLKKDLQRALKEEGYTPEQKQAKERKKRPSPFQKQETEKEKKQEEIQERMTQMQRLQKHISLSKKTKRGQPVMKNVVSHLLDKIQKSMKT
ncbi:hypothetical protein EDD86DRAFT_246755 [Gorgonomyces haynaldii]|nr:hypothetical protein EDD86DRAFT_246755 [Gorgonomyces haynaldii]